MNHDTMHQELLELLTTDAASGKEGAIAALLRSKLEALGLQVTMDDAGTRYPGECGNLLAVRDGELEGALLLCSHMDRVPNGLGIQPVERDGVLYSNGSTILAADDISGVCAILEGLRRVLAAGKPLPRLEVLFTVQEETGLFGAKAMDMGKLQAKVGYFFDSPGGVGRFVNGAPGMYRLKAEITGRPAHAGNEPEKGINAAKILCDILSTLRQGRLDPESTSNFPVLTTGSTATNVVCDFAAFQGEARSRDPKRLADYVDYFETHCKTVAQEQGAEITIQKEEGFLPFLIDEDAPVLATAKTACNKLDIPFRAEVGGGGMDANIFNARGLSCVGVATGYTKNHTKDEQLVLADFYKSGELAAALIETFAQGCAAR